MIIAESKFYLKFGKAKEALAIWKEITDEFEKSTMPKNNYRMMSDLSGRAYTLVWEMHMKNFNEINPMNYYWSINPKVGEMYQRFVQCCHSAEQQMYKIELEV